MWNNILFIIDFRDAEVSGLKNLETFRESQKQSRKYNFPNLRNYRGSTLGGIIFTNLTSFEISSDFPYSINKFGIFIFARIPRDSELLPKFNKSQDFAI